MIDPALEARAQRLLNRVRTIAEALAQQYNQLGRGHAESSVPTAQVSTLEQVWIRIHAAHSDAEMESAIRWGIDECDQLQATRPAARCPRPRRSSGPGSSRPTRA
jgi:hypothetical protein